MHEAMTPSAGIIGPQEKCLQVPRYSLHERRFVMAINGNGRPIIKTVFTFAQEGHLLWGSFQGDGFVLGQMLGLYVDETQIRLHLQWLCHDQAIHVGTLCGLVSDDKGRGLTLFLNWQDGTNPQEQGWASFRELAT